MRKMYILLSKKDEETENKLTMEQFDWIWDTDDRFYKQERAETWAKKYTKQFNKKFNTNYEWQDLFDIDEEWFDSQGYRV